MKYVVAILAIGLCGCSGYKQGAVVSWTHPVYKTCEPNVAVQLPFDIEVSVLNVNLTSSRYDNLNSARPLLLRTDGSYTDLSVGLKDVPFEDYVDASTFSPDGKYVYLNKVWENPINAIWEQVTQQLNFTPDMYRADIYRMNLDSGAIEPLTADSASYYNSGVRLDGSKLGYIALNGGTAVTHTMNLDGTDKEQLQSNGGFTYGLSFSPDHTHYAYHSEYKVWIGDFSTMTAKEVHTPCNFNFGPLWSPDSSKIVFYCGATNYAPAIYMANADGSNVHIVSDRNGYNGSVPFLDVTDYHNGTTDNMAWLSNSELVFAIKLNGSGQLVKFNIDTEQAERLTDTQPGTLNYYPAFSSDKRYMVFNSNRTGRRNTFYMDLQTRETVQVTNVDAGCGAFVPMFRPDSLGVGQ